MGRGQIQRVGQTEMDVEVRMAPLQHELSTITREQANSAEQQIGN